MTLRQRAEHLLRIAALISVLGAVCFISAVTTIRIAIRGRIVEMPNLVGQPLPEAQRILEANQLRLRIADRIYSPLPENAVVRQSPRAGEQMKLSQNAHIVVSLGPQTVQVPAVEGFSVRGARITLLDTGLQPGEVATVRVPWAASDVVLRQSPPAGTTATSPRVNLLIAASEPPPTYVMPAVVGLPQAQAERILAAAGLRVTARQRLAETGSPPGTVIGQTPPRGARIQPDATVRLSIAD